MREEYRSQIRLLLNVLPLVAQEDALALKGGTAINFFWRDFPRLSVDIDLTYLPVNNRKESLCDISRIVRNLAKEIKKYVSGARISKHKSGDAISRLTIGQGDVQIKLEVNTVLRGSIFDAVEKDLCYRVQNEFELFIAIKTLSFEDLYGGKLCAALDRQHPRDIFDVKLLLDQEGITEKIRTAFIGYLISHSRPMNELMNPNVIDLEYIYRKEFEGMTIKTAALSELISIQNEMPGILLDTLQDREKEFLISFKKGNPKWELMPITHLKDLPGVRWKLQNIRKMGPDKHKEALTKLERVLLQ